MKLYYTRAELIKIRILRVPGDAKSPDLEFNALAGYVETRRGFIEYSFYRMELDASRSQT